MKKNHKLFIEFKEEFLELTGYTLEQAISGCRDATSVNSIVASIKNACLHAYNQGYIDSASETINIINNFNNKDLDVPKPTPPAGDNLRGPTVL